jgi:hypothetical protein
MNLYSSRAFVGDGANGREQAPCFGMLFPAIPKQLVRSVSSGNVHEAQQRESHERDRENHDLLHDHGRAPFALHRAREGVCAHGGVRERVCESAREHARYLHDGVHECGSGRARENANARARDCLPCVWTPFDDSRIGRRMLSTYRLGRPL